METRKHISNDTDYKEVMSQIDRLMARGSNKVKKDELAEIRKLSLSAQEYEQSKYEIEDPTTLAGIIEMKMYDMRLKQKELAKKLNVSDAKLSLIMNGKQKPDIGFLKAVHKELDVKADLLLNVI
jgi:HTH-type transcriptional regulator/antitoxin HigA